jgi:two-component system, chemotaxis family, protein-glutamate methylesterase/glutaminase
MANRDIITIGASAGGVEALIKLVAALPADLPASVFIVQHVSPQSRGELAQVLGYRGALPVEMAADRRQIERSHIYVAPPDYHLMIDRSYMYITHGPRENMTRPAVDPLFRSAAVVHGPHVIGVILSGTLDDGAAGLLAIKRCGGVAVVQDPEDAMYPDMPRSAMEIVDVDASLALGDLPPVLAQWAQEPPGEPMTPPFSLLAEVEMSRSESGNIGHLNEIGELVPLTCSECGGPLWQIKDDKMTRFRCRVGHAYTAKTLASEITDAVERSLWAAVQMMDERVRTLEHLADTEQQKDHRRSSASFHDKAAEVREHTERLRQLLLSINQ